MFIFLSSSLNLPNETILVKSFIFPAATLTHLQSISFYKSNLLTEVGSILLANSGLTSLKFLSIRTCSLVTDESLASILSVQHVLESLTLKKLNKIDGRCLRSLSLCSPFLKELRLGKLRSLQSKFLLDAFHKLSFPALAVLDVRNGPILSSNEIASFLTYLTPSPLVAVRLVRTFANLVDEHVAAIGRAHSPTLESLDVSECSHVSWEAVSSLLLGCPKLHSLDIGYCSQLASANPKDVASAIRAASQRLRFLNMTSLLSVSLAASASLVDALTALPNLQDVRLCGSTKLTDEMVELLCKSLGRSLLKLDISSSPELTLRSVAHALRHCERLEALFFVCVVPIVRSTADALAADSSFAAALDEVRRRPYDVLPLRQLWLTNTQIGASLLNELVAVCAALEELDVSAIKTVTDDLLLHICSRRPPLRFLNLKACTQVTDKGICELVAACGATLNCLVLSGLRHLTDASLLMMQSHAPNMRKIYADGCTGLSLGAFVRLKKSVRGEFAVHHWLPPRSSRQSALPPDVDVVEAAELEAARSSSWYSSSSSQHLMRHPRRLVAGDRLLRLRSTLTRMFHGLVTAPQVSVAYVLSAGFVLVLSLLVWKMLS